MKIDKNIRRAEKLTGKIIYEFRISWLVFGALAIFALAKFLPPYPAKGLLLLVSVLLIAVLMILMANENYIAMFKAGFVIHHGNTAISAYWKDITKVVVIKSKLGKIFKYGVAVVFSNDNVFISPTCFRPERLRLEWFKNGNLKEESRIEANKQ